MIHLIAKYYISVVGLGQRCPRAETAPQIDALLVSPDTMTKGGGPHFF